MLERWMSDEAPPKKMGRPKGGENVRRSFGTPFAHVVAVCGLTYEEAAVYLDRSIQSVRSYANGDRRTPEDVLEAMALLWEQISYRLEPSKELPPAAAERRKALVFLRTRGWKTKDRSPEKGDEG